DKRRTNKNSKKIVSLIDSRTSISYLQHMIWNMIGSLKVCELYHIFIIICFNKKYKEELKRKRKFYYKEFSMIDGRKREIKSSMCWKKTGVAPQTAEITHQMIKIAPNFEKSHLN